MICKFEDFEKFKEKAREFGVEEDLEQLKTLSILFFEAYPKYMIIKLVSYEGSPNMIMILSKEYCLVYPLVKSIPGVSLSKLKKESSWGESTFVAYCVFKCALEGYQKHFRMIDLEIDALEDSLHLEQIESTSKKLKKFRDLIDDFLHLLIRAEDKDMKFIDTAVLDYEFDLLLAQTRHLADRCRTARKELSLTSSKYDTLQTKKLNASIEKLTKIMMFLTIVGIVISVPNTIATVYGIASFGQNADQMQVIELLVFATLVSVLFSLAYLYNYMKK